MIEGGAYALKGLQRMTLAQISSLNGQGQSFTFNHWRLQTLTRDRQSLSFTFMTAVQRKKES